MSDYTPGRWTVSPEFPLCVCESDGHKVDPIAYAVPYRPADFKLAEVEANARLIAAAPELLEASKRVTKCLMSQPIGDKLAKSDYQQMAFIDLLEAIEKAEGLA